MSHTGALYTIPRLQNATNDAAEENVTWPRYDNGEFRQGRGIVGTSMLELTKEEAEALQVCTLVTKTRVEVYGAWHQKNIKKVGVSKAKFVDRAVSEESMPTPRAAAAYRFLMKNNRFYRKYVEEQRCRREEGKLYITSFELFIQSKGIECAIWPTLYPETCFSDTGGLQAYREEYEDSTTRVFSIGTSFTKEPHVGGSYLQRDIGLSVLPV